MTFLVSLANQIQPGVEEEDRVTNQIQSGVEEDRAANQIQPSVEEDRVLDNN